MDIVEDFANNVGDTVGGAIETLVYKINNALNRNRYKAGIKAFFFWLGGITKGVFSLVAASIKGVFGIVGGIIGGLIKITKGIFTLQESIIPGGIWDVFSPVFGTVIVVLGKFIALVQSVLYAQAFERPLTRLEKSQLKSIFKNSLKYDIVGIIEGHTGLFGINSRPFVLGNTIYMKTNTFPTDILVHEAVHVWQYQHTGNRYASDALAAQWFVRDGYNWEREINVRNKLDWTQFNREAQAQFFQDLWKSGELRTSSETTVQTGNGSFFNADWELKTRHFEVNDTDYTSIATEAVKRVRNK